MLRGAVLELDPNMSLEPIVDFEAYTRIGVLPQLIAAGITSALGLLAILLAGLGVYGVVAFVVTQRTREIGVRMALGAGRASVLRLVVRDGLALALPGEIFGLVAAVGAGYLLRFLLLGLSPVDPLSLVGVGLLLALVVVVASLVPGRRAASIDPMRALRGE